MYYRGAGAAVVVFDVGNMETFNGAKRWVAELRSKADANVVIALAGNKSDAGFCKGLSAEACAEYANSTGVLFMETSAKTGAKVRDVFNAIARALPKDQKAAVNATPLAVTSSSSGSCC
jgi:GTPase SAR1 family protein